MIVKEKVTDQVSSAGTDWKQPLCKLNKKSIVDLPQRAICKPQIIVVSTEKKI